VPDTDEYRIADGGRYGLCVDWSRRSRGKPGRRW
jgi:hypothetical protein